MGPTVGQWLSLQGPFFHYGTDGQTEHCHDNFKTKNFTGSEKYRFRLYDCISVQSAALDAAVVQTALSLSFYKI